jgi:hypothetical protein
MNQLSLRNNQLKFIETARKLPIILLKFLEEHIPQFNKGKPEDVNMYPVGLANTGISTNYVCPNISLIIVYT